MIRWYKHLKEDARLGRLVKGVLAEHEYAVVAIVAETVDGLTVYKVRPAKRGPE